MTKLLKHIDSRQQADSNDAAMRMAFSLAGIQDIAYFQQEYSRQTSRKKLMKVFRPSASQWKPATGALLLSGLFVSNEHTADRAVQSGAVPELVRLVRALLSLHSSVNTQTQSICSMF